MGKSIKIVAIISKKNRIKTRGVLKWSGAFIRKRAICFINSFKKVNIADHNVCQLETPDTTLSKKNMEALIKINDKKAFQALVQFLRSLNIDVDTTIIKEKKQIGRAHV